MNTNSRIFLNGLTMMVLSAAKRLGEGATAQAIVTEIEKTTGKLVKVESVHTAASRLRSRGQVEITAVRGAGSSRTSRKVSVIRILDQGLKARAEFLSEVLTFAEPEEVYTHNGEQSPIVSDVARGRS